MGNIKIIRGVFDTKIELEHAGMAAGFPSPADDNRHETLDFNRDYIRHPEASFYGDVEGDSMKDAGLFDGDRVIIDRAVEPHDGSIVVAWWDGGFTMKFLDLTHKKTDILNCVQPMTITLYSVSMTQMNVRCGVWLFT
jgi:DNA polymerase V